MVESMHQAAQAMYDLSVWAAGLAVAVGFGFAALRACIAKFL